MSGTFGDPEIIVIDTDILIVGGGMAGCGAAVEAKRWAGDGLKITLVDKASLDRPTASAMGAGVINTYLGDEPPEDYCRRVAADLMGITRDDLVFDVGRHVDGSVHMFEEWGLPIWKDKGSEGVLLKDGGKPVRPAKGQIVINGEGYKPIIAEAVKQALGGENIYERVFIVNYLRDRRDDNRIAGAVGFSVREHKVYVFQANAVLNVAGGAVNLFRPRSVGEGNDPAWFSGRNAGSSYAMAAEVGAELTMMESRFVPTRPKDGAGLFGAWFLPFTAKASNGYGEDCTVKNAALRADFAPYGQAAVVPRCLQNQAMVRESKEGRGPIYMETSTPTDPLSDILTCQQRQHAEAGAWDDFADMCIADAGHWAGMPATPDDRKPELMMTEPQLLGADFGCCGIWVSGPADLAPAQWQWGYNRMTTLVGLFSAGDGVGASGHKFASGSHAEGRIAGKEMVRFCQDQAGFKPVLRADMTTIVEEIYRPVRNDFEQKEKTPFDDTSADTITAKVFQMRLQACLDEYVAGASTYYQTNKVMLETGLHQIETLRTDSKTLRAKDLHELMRAWEGKHRLWTAEAHVRHILFREETRYPGFCDRSDFPGLNDGEWKCFVNSRYHPETGQWTVKKVPHIDIVEKH